MRDIKEKYFKWMCRKVGADLYGHEKLLRLLFGIEFNYIIDRDDNREADGIDLRYHFGYERSIDHARISFYLDHEPCSVLEMMVALAIRCESSVDTDKIDDPAAMLFDHMLRNLGLIYMDDNNFSEDYVRDTIEIFLNREYERDGQGGLFHIPGCKQDLRDVEIWFQAMWYINYIMEEGE